MNKTLEDQERAARATAQQARERIKKLETERQSLALEALGGDQKAAEDAEFFLHGLEKAPSLLRYASCQSCSEVV